MIKREISGKINQLLKKYPILALTGPRQSGKSTLLKFLFPDYQYLNLEVPKLRELAQEDPESFFEIYQGKLILDEVQHVPSLFSYLQSIVDDKKIMGQFILSGSSQFKLREQITQSLAGRVTLLNLLPLSVSEIIQHNPSLDETQINPFEMIVQGQYPAIFDRQIDPEDFYGDYIQTYVERDVRSLINIKDLKLFQLFLKHCAARVGSVVNYTSLGNDIGVSRETVKKWIHLLEASYILYELPPYHRNLNKRLIKSPKLFFYDVGLLCYLLGINSTQQLETHALKGGIFENFIITELIKDRFNQHRVPAFYFWQDAAGREVDLMTEENNQLALYEIKSSRTFHADFAKNIAYLRGIFKTDGISVEPGKIIYAGTLAQKRELCEVIPWFNLVK